ncbi:hypothetical protein G3580_08960 [Nitrogeniibacter mangrovi]|uniref:Toxin CptA n=1 Tax=Nitrogeniibacter mangrovi TaxID=2016596 RepID=A0A6C1B302_9RHOO|nr:protein YgfX [Nitrogeniibacter mangrovi]QID17763.1 hypothetical protein G3580_08960 [Nitrogeniibacter mangrovi]
MVKYPRPLYLKPPRSLRQLALSLIIGAVFLVAFQPDAFGAMGGAVMALCAVALWRHAVRCANQSITLLADGYWIPPGGGSPMSLVASSTQLGGVVWLHGRNDEGERCALMLMPDGFVDEQDYRRLCAWYRMSP